MKKLVFDLLKDGSVSFIDLMGQSIFFDYVSSPSVAKTIIGKKCGLTNCTIHKIRSFYRDGYYWVVVV